MNHPLPQVVLTRDAGNGGVQRAPEDSGCDSESGAFPLGEGCLLFR